MQRGAFNNSLEKTTKRDMYELALEKEWHKHNKTKIVYDSPVVSPGRTAPNVNTFDRYRNTIGDTDL